MASCPQPITRTARIRDGESPVPKFGKEAQISYRSTEWIVRHLNLTAAKLAIRFRFLGSPLRTGHIVNAVCLFVARSPEDEAAAFLGPLLHELERYVEDSGEPLRLDPPRRGTGKTPPPKSPKK